jgi:hypothetical protein
MKSFKDSKLDDNSQSVDSLNSVELENAILLLLLRCIVEVTKEKEKEQERERESEEKGQTKKGKKKKTSRQPVTLHLVTPCDINQFQSFLLYSAATRAAQFFSWMSSNHAPFSYSVGGLVCRGTAAVAGALSLASCTSFRAALKGKKNKDVDIEKEKEKESREEPVVLYFRWMNVGPSPRPALVEAALIHCEGGSARTGNLLGFDRLATLSSLRGTSSLSPSAEELAGQVSFALDVLLRRAGLSSSSMVRNKAVYLHFLS